MSHRMICWYLGFHPLNSLKPSSLLFIKHSEKAINAVAARTGLAMTCWDAAIMVGVSFSMLPQHPMMGGVPAMATHTKLKTSHSISLFFLIPNSIQLSLFNSEEAHDGWDWLIWRRVKRRRWNRRQRSGRIGWRGFGSWGYSGGIESQKKMRRPPTTTVKR